VTFRSAESPRSFGPPSLEDAFAETIGRLERATRERLSESGRRLALTEFARCPAGVRALVDRVLAKYRAGTTDQALGLLVHALRCGEARVSASPGVDDRLFAWARRVLPRLPADAIEDVVEDRIKAMRLMPREAAEVRAWLLEQVAA
jgi:hypothetical protein